MSEISESELQQIRAIQPIEEERTRAAKLPSWVKCAFCGEGPKWGDLLGELVRHSSALAHQSCAKKRGLMFGMNAGTIQEIDNKVKAVE